MIVEGNIVAATISNLRRNLLLLGVSAMVTERAVYPDGSSTHATLRECLHYVKCAVKHDLELLQGLVGSHPAEVGMQVRIDHRIPSQPHESLIQSMDTGSLADDIVSLVNDIANAPTGD